MKNNIILPKTTSEGKPRISYSQLKSWKSDTAFKFFEGKEISGSSGYILQYFMDYKFPPCSKDLYAEFGLKVEDYICNKVRVDLDDDEIKVLDTIKPIGVFQEPIEIDFGDFVVTGFIDDCNEDRSILRDYKTASKASAKQYEGQDYFQLDLYSLDFYKKHGLIPQLEVVVIERKGYHKKPPLKVKDTFTLYRTTNKARLNYVEAQTISIVTEISNCFEEFLKLNKI